MLKKFKNYLISKYQETLYYYFKILIIFRKIYLNHKIVLLYKEFKFAIPISIVDSRCAISRKYKFIYFRIPKAANSTIISSLHFAENRGSEETKINVDKLKGLYTRPTEIPLNEFKKIYHGKLENDHRQIGHWLVHVGREKLIVQRGKQQRGRFTTDTG